MIQCLGLALKYFNKFKKEVIISEENVGKSSSLLALGGWKFGGSLYLSFIVFGNFPLKK